MVLIELIILIFQSGNYLLMFLTLWAIGILLYGFYHMISECIHQIKRRKNRRMIKRKLKAFSQYKIDKGIF